MHISLPVLIPIGLIELILLIVALTDLARRHRDEVVFHRKWPWVVICLIISGIGPIIYLAAGRKQA